MVTINNKRGKSFNISKHTKYSGDFRGKFNYNKKSCNI